jgi:hypothetical protein
VHRLQVESLNRQPRPRIITTSFADRQNLNVRTGIRRYTRLTNAISRRIENHATVVAVYYFSYNCVKIPGTLRATPAMAVNVMDRLVGSIRPGCDA